MPKVTLTFTLPEEEVEMRDAIDGWQWEHILWDLDQELRSMMKHQGLTTVEIDWIRDRINVEMSERGLTFS